MRITLLPAALVTGLLSGCSDTAPTQPETFTVPVVELRTAAQSHHFIAVQSGDEEVPPVETRGHGTATFTLSTDGTTLSYRLITAGVEGITQSHIHLGAPGANGPVVVFLFGLVPAGVSSNGVLAEGTITQSNLIPRPDIGFGATMAELVAAMRSGGAYVNVHTLDFPGGEVRGQVREGGPTQ
ncbi:MAG TPA: CHRD domain-containing protein [Gemmatimonadales bacterium]|nr:CHRD domain-containing protein [Gemmatimonadales bacterium]